MVQVSTTTTNGSPLAVELFAPDGHRVFASRTDLGATGGSITLPIRRLAPGAYLLRTTLDGQSDARRIAVF